MKKMFVVIMLLLSANAFAMETYQFEFYTNNGNYNDSPDVKLFVDVDSYSPTQVSFNFRNDSTIDCTVKTIAIEDNMYLDKISTVENHTGVKFSSPANPPNFGGLIPSFNESFVLSANADAPSGLNKNGIDKGEYLRIITNLENGKSYSDVINGLDSGEFRIGIHVGSFPDETSEKGINKKPPVIPVPAAAVLSLIGFGCVTSLRKRIA